MDNYVSRETLKWRRNCMNNFFDIPVELIMILGICFFLIIVLFILNIVNSVRIGRLKKKYEKFNQ